jgi:ComF family protein
MAPLAKPLGRFMERALPLDSSFDAVVPVPLHWRRKWQRGFNQAELLARHISKKRQVPVVQALQRRKSAGVQASLSVAARRRNVAGAFTVKPGVNLSGKRVLLIDDVMTTGATGSACAAALKRGGATSVSLLTLARVDRRWTDHK